MTPLDALHQISGAVITTERRRAPREAAVADTHGYILLELAYGFASLGDSNQARGLMAAVAAAPPSDPVHRYLEAAFRERIEQAIEDRPLGAPLSDRLVAQLGGFDRVARGKIDRLRDASRILAPLERPSAVEAWLRDGSANDALSRVPYAARTNAIQALLAMAANDVERRVQLVDSTLAALGTIERSSITPLLRRSLNVIALIAAPKRALRYARAMVAAEYAGELALVSECSDWLCAALGTSDAIDTTLDIAVPLLYRAQLRRELVELLIAAQSISSAAILTKLTIAAGLAWLGDDGAAALFEEARAALAGPLLPSAKVEIVRALAAGYAQLPPDAALPAILGLLPGFVDVTDSLSTSTHFAISVLVFVESLVLAVVAHARRWSPPTR